MSLQLNGTDGVTFNDGSEQWAAASPIGTKNLIINGNMQIAQRGTVAVTAGGGETYTLDRYAMLNYWGSGQVTVLSSTDAPTGHSNSIGLTVNTSAPLNGASGYYCTLFQCIEGYNTQHAYNQNITISFWVKSSITGTYSVTLTNVKNSSTTSTTRVYVAEYTINSVNTWEQKTITVDLSSGTSSGTWNTTNGTGLCLGFNLGGESNRKGDTYLDTWGTVGSTFDIQSADQVNWLSTTGATFNISQLQLEVGDTATPFEVMPYDMNLARCQRYYWKWTGESPSGYPTFAAGHVFGTTDVRVALTYPCTMRAIPNVGYGGTITINSGGVTISATALTASYAGKHGSLVQLSSSPNTLTQGWGMVLHSQNTTSSYIYGDAEL